MVEIKIMRLPNGKTLPLPRYETIEAAGFDVRAAIESDFDLLPQARALIATGFAIQLPKGYEAQVRPRSGLAIKHGISLVNSPGTIDSDYRGELKIPLINLSQETFTLKPAMRIAQIIIAPIAKANFTEVANLDDSQRGEGGFGSTGV